MTEQSTPTQEPAQEKAPNLDAVLEGAINQVMEPNETPPEKEEKEQWRDETCPPCLRFHYIPSW